MFGTLFWKECRQICKSLVFYLYVVILVLFLTSQLNGDSISSVKEPEKGQDYYGLTTSTDKTDIMEVTLGSLFLNSYHNSFAAYPMGFYKHVILNEKETEEINRILETCSGKDRDTLEKEMLKHFNSYDQSNVEGAIQDQAEYRIPVKKGFSYENFCEQMKRVSEMIGNGSGYEKKFFDNGVSVPSDYETEQKAYQAICDTDRITGAYMRLFCDYAGVMLSVLPVFLGVTRCLRDKRAQVSQIIYARKAPGAVIIASRYLANVCMSFLPVLILAFVMQMPAQYHAGTLGVTPDTLAFLKYALIWLLPEIMAVLAVSFVITELTENVISIFIQVFWAVASLFSAAVLHGSFGLQLVVRWNTMGATELFEQQKQELLMNRGFYFLLALMLTAVTIAIYEKKRGEGESIYGKIFKGRK